MRQAAACLGVAPATAHRWSSRWREASAEQRRSLSCLATRSSRPRSCPWRLSDQAERSILHARERTNYGPARLAGLVGHGRSTVWKALRRHGASRRARGARQTYRRYEWSQPGALLHIDAKQLPRFERPGHFAHGDRSDHHRSRGAGYLKVICVVDDHTRLAYAEPHSDEDQHSVSVTLARAVRWFSQQGCGPVEAVMSDNHKAYTSRRFQALLSELGAKHIPTPPRTPRWNGKSSASFRPSTPSGPTRAPGPTA